MGSRLVDLCELIVDSEHKTAPVAVEGYPMIRTPNIGEGRLLLKGVRRVDEETYATWTRRAVPREGDLILAREAPVGNVAMVPAGIRPILGQRTVLIRPDRRKVEPAFLQYLMLGRELQHRMWSLSNGATVPHLNMKDIRQLEIPNLPPLSVQRKIAAVLGAYDELIENNLRRIEILEEMAQTVYREWFVNFRYPGHENVPLVDSSLGPIPDGWKVGEFGIIVEHIRVNINPAKAPDEEFDHYSFAAFDGSQTASVELGSTMKSGKLLVDQPSVLLAKLNPRIPRVWFARPAGERRSITSSEFLVLRSRPGIPLEYVYAISSDPGFHAKIAKMSGGTSTSHQRLKVEDLMAQPHVAPEERVLRLFADQARPMYELREILIRLNVNLRETRDLLLPKLVSGEIDVSDLDIDTEWLVA